MKKFLFFAACALLMGFVTSCGDDNDEPGIPEFPGASDDTGVRVEGLQGTWKGIFRNYTGVRDELITAKFYGDNKSGSIDIWWTHYLNMGQYYFTGTYKLSGNQLTLDGKMGPHGQYPSKSYNRTVPIKFPNQTTMEFEFDVDYWILTKR